MQKNLITKGIDNKTLFSREGNKYTYKEFIIEQFPPHYKYIEAFFGTGAIFFNKPLAPYNVINDSSDTIYEFYNLFKNPEMLEQFKKDFDEALAYRKIIDENKDKIEYKILGIITTMFNTSGSTLKNRKVKPSFIERLDMFRDHYFKYLKDTIIFNNDVFKFFSNIDNRTKMSKNTLIYLDPPYSIQKGRLDDNRGWNINKLEELVKYLTQYEWKFCISEMDNEEVLNIFTKYNLNISVISIAQGLSKQFKTNRSEVIATNY